MLARSFEPPAFPLRHAAKDLRLIEAVAERQGLDLPLLTTIAERFGQAVARGHGVLDMTATFLTTSGDRAG
jgi:3-hydroxyisobutyrate dehydrogenase